MVVRNDGGIRKEMTIFVRYSVFTDMKREHGQTKRVRRRAKPDLCNYVR